MKSKKTILTWILALTITISFGQTKDPILMKVGNNAVTKDEFKSIFTKNLKDSVITNQALDEYLVLFTKFKLKVTEAESMGLDTTKKFRDELDGYRKQLARPYMTDVSMNEELVKEAYDRMQEEIRASHILVKCDLDAMPKDTLAAYNKAMAFKERILKGEDFATVAGGKIGSDDPSASKNGGDIGYFTALQMVYPFENACYKMKIGGVSNPIRTKFGYHIIKITDRRAARGQVKVAHILISMKDEDDPMVKEAANIKAGEILDKIKAGEDFSSLAKQFSDDQSSAKKGGELVTFGPGKMVLEFENASFELKNIGDVSGLVRTNYGFHIIKLLEKIPVQSFDEMKGQLRQKISRDTRAIIPKKAFVDKLKKKYKFKETISSLDLFYSSVDTSILQSRWRKEYMMASKTYVRSTSAKPSNDGLIKEVNEGGKEKAPAKENIPLDEKKVAAMKKQIIFSFAEKKFSQYDFAVYLETNQRKDKDIELKKYILGSYRSWTQDELNNYENSKLEENYPEFRLLMKEYRDGILLFELTDQKVWNKAVKDTAGLRAYHNIHKSKYVWPVRYDSEIYTCATREIANSLTNDLNLGYIEKKIEKPVDTTDDKSKGKSKSKSKSKSKEPEFEKIPVTNDLLREKYNKDSQLNLKIESGKYVKDDKEILKSTNLQPGLSQIIEKDGLFIVIKIKEVLQPANKTLNEAKGVITADYQGHLEAEWIKELESKYKVEVFKDVLYSIK
jgi:peptidyl-prolyl cis-trans isomerase SurA